MPDRLNLINIILAAARTTAAKPHPQTTAGLQLSSRYDILILLLPLLPILLILKDRETPDYLSLSLSLSDVIRVAGNLKTARRTKLRTRATAFTSRAVRPTFEPVD